MSHFLPFYLLCMQTPLKAVHFPKHVIPKTFDIFLHFSSPLHQVEFNCNISCDLLVTGRHHTTTLQKLSQYEYIRNYSEINRKKSRVDIPAKLNVPILLTSPDRIKLTIQQQRLHCKQLESQLEKMKAAIKKFNTNLSSELSKDLISIFSGADKKNVPPFMKLFWEEQQKYLQSSTPSSIR